MPGLVTQGAAVAPDLLHQAGLVEQLVAVEDPFPVPGDATQPEGDLAPLPAAPAHGRALGLLRPALQHWHDPLVQHARTAFAPVLPGEEPVDVVPGRAGSRRALLPDQGEVGDGDHPRTPGQLPRIAVTVAEGVELLDVAQLDPGLVPHPAAQAELHGPVLLRVEGTEGDGVHRCPVAVPATSGGAGPAADPVAVLRARPADRQDARDLAGDRQDHRVEADRQARRHNALAVPASDHSIRRS